MRWRVRRYKRFMMLSLILFIIGTGLLAGFLAGLLGIGGGIVLVPALYYGFIYLGFDDAHLMHIAIGTSLGVIIPTGLISAYSHYKRGNIDFCFVRRIAVFIVIGVLSGAAAADMMSGTVLKMIFACALVMLSFLMLINVQGKMKSETQSLSKNIADMPAGIGIGALSALMGIGGATLSVPYMGFRGMVIHRAIGTASAIGPIIALPGAIGFIVAGLDQAPGISYTAGYFHWLAWVLIVPFSMIAAPIGVRVNGAVNAVLLKKIFALFVLIVAAKMMFDAF